jgi:hypothetical protein
VTIHSEFESLVSWENDMKPLPFALDCHDFSAPTE